MRSSMLDEFKAKLKELGASEEEALARLRCLYNIQTLTLEDANEWALGIIMKDIEDIKKYGPLIIMPIDPSQRVWNDPVTGEWLGDEIWVYADLQDRRHIIKLS